MKNNSLGQYLLENKFASIFVCPTGQENGVVTEGCIVVFIYSDSFTKAVINDQVVSILGISNQELNWTLKAIADDPYGQLAVKEVKPEGFSICQDLISSAVFEGRKKIAEADALAQGLLLLEWLSTR